MKTFIQFYEAIKHQAGSETTQVAHTTSTYRKTAIKLSPMLPEGSKVLDYGAGMGKGTDAMRDVLKQHTVHSYEPSPKNWKPNHISSETLPNDYNAVVSHNVLNVLEPKLRDAVTKDLLSRVKVGGHVVVGARTWKGDVGATKNFTPSDSEKNAIWVKRKNGDVYQKGFEGDELIDHMKKHGGDKFEFKKIGGLAASTIIGKRIK